MSVDHPDSGLADTESDQVADLETRTAPKPTAHGAGVINVFNDLNFEDDIEECETLYDTALDWWREHIGDKDQEPGLVTDFEANWLPELPSSREHVLLVTSSRWKAGTGIGEEYTAYYQQHIKLRERDADGDLHKPALALHIEVMPQYEDLVYKSGDRLECPYGEGTRAICRTTWAESPIEIETRMYDALRAVYGDEALNLAADGIPIDRNDESRRLLKAEAHVRLAEQKKNSVVESIDQSKELIDWGGRSEIEAAQQREAKGWIESRLVSDRWDLLGFDDMPFKTGLKLYQVQDWHKRPEDDPFRHPKLEAAFEGVDRGALPHVDDWDEVMAHLRSIVSTHLAWAGVEREDLVSDDYFDGSLVDEYEYQHPEGRRSMLRRRYEDRATDVWRAAVHPQTTAIYDILRVVAREKGATYDMLVDRTGLARSTVRYHVAKLEDKDVLKRLGNPTLVVYDAEALRDKAEEILRSVQPDDTPEDAEERAEEREERREEQQNSDDEVNQEETSQARSAWDYLEKLSMTSADLYTALETTDGELGDRDVRVRLDRVPDRLR